MPYRHMRDQMIGETLFSLPTREAHKLISSSIRVLFPIHKKPRKSFEELLGKRLESQVKDPLEKGLSSDHKLEKESA